MGSSSNRIDIAWLPAGSLLPNPWNPNAMQRDKFAKLKNEIGRNGFSAPVLVRQKGFNWQIVDGEHRCRAAKELGLSEVPCVIADLTDDQAKVKTLQLNGLHGENDPEKLARLLGELAERVDLGELAGGLPWDADEIERVAAMAESETEKALARGPWPDDELAGLEMLAVVVTAGQKAVISRAMRKTGADGEGEALAEIADAYLS